MKIPENSKILDVQITPNGNLFPLALMGNNPRHLAKTNDEFKKFLSKCVDFALKLSN